MPKINFQQFLYNASEESGVRLVITLSFLGQEFVAGTKSNPKYTPEKFGEVTGEPKH